MLYFVSYMELRERVNAFAELGVRLAQLDDLTAQQWAIEANAVNKWFTVNSVRESVKNIAAMLNPDKLRQWISRYDWKERESRRVGLVLAGNIPMVGIHDIICVLVSGHSAEIKLSTQDAVLIPKVLDILIQIDGRFSKQVHFMQKLTGADAFIATGSDNSSRYFDYYFSHKPNIIRKNRTSVAVLNGFEEKQDIARLGEDIFAYFGLGCRNVSKIYIPDGYTPSDIYSSLEAFAYVVDHNKYANNYEYTRAIYLLKSISCFDNGFLLLKEDEALASPISVLYYEYYHSEEALKNKLELQKEKIQIVTSSTGWWSDSIPFGKAQEPELWDYADNVDTLQFLTRL